MLELYRQLARYRDKYRDSEALRRLREVAKQERQMARDHLNRMAYLGWALKRLGLEARVEWWYGRDGHRQRNFATAYARLGPDLIVQVSYHEPRWNLFCGWMGMLQLVHPTYAEPLVPSKKGVDYNFFFRPERPDEFGRALVEFEEAFAEVEPTSV